MIIFNKTIETLLKENKEWYSLNREYLYDSVEQLNDVNALDFLIYKKEIDVMSVAENTPYALMKEMAEVINLLTGKKTLRHYRTNNFSSKGFAYQYYMYGKIKIEC